MDWRTQILLNDTGLQVEHLQQVLVGIKELLSDDLDPLWFVLVLSIGRQDIKASVDTTGQGETSGRGGEGTLSAFVAATVDLGSGFGAAVFPGALTGQH